MEAIKIVNYLEALDESVSFLSGDFLVSKVDNKFLLGPAITKGFCLSCFRKRVLSSEFNEITLYKEINKKDQKKINKLLAIHNVTNDIILEIKRNKVVKRHKLIKVPGCSH